MSRSRSMHYNKLAFMPMSLRITSFLAPTYRLCFSNTYQFVQIEVLITMIEP